MKVTVSNPESFLTKPCLAVDIVPQNVQTIAGEWSKGKRLGNHTMYLHDATIMDECAQAHTSAVVSKKLSSEKDAMFKLPRDELALHKKNAT